mgnify:CR=1 FL=1
MTKKSNLSKNDKKILEAEIYMEVLNSYSPSDIKKFTFKTFFSEVDVQNGYEEHWEVHKKQLKPIYKIVFNEEYYKITNPKLFSV